MDHRRNHRQDAAAAKAGISVRSARRIEGDPMLPSQRSQPRPYRTRANPFDAVWDDEVVPMLIRLPGLQAVTILRDLQNRHPGRFPDSQLRTLQRHLRSWHAVHGTEREVMFRQDHPPGQLGLSDFTVSDELGVTVEGQPFPHRLYHFTLAHSQWEYAQVVEGGESFSALAVGLQNALWLLGGVPAEHRTDSLSAAYRNLDQDAQDDITERYRLLCAHYAMRASRNNRGRSHENGSVESPHRHLDQALMLRGSRAFGQRRDYHRFLAEVVALRNARREPAFAVDRAALRPLPERRTTDFTEATVIVASTGMFHLHGVYYSVPARLIGQRLKVHLFDDRLECFLGTTALATLPRRRKQQGKPRPYVVDYRHMLASLRAKPGALRNLVWRDALFPRPAFRQAWDALLGHGPVERACRDTVALLDLAARHGEAPVAALLEADLGAGRVPDPAALHRAPANARGHGLPADRRPIRQPAAQLRGDAMTTPLCVDTARLPLLLDELRLPTVSRLWDSLAERARHENWSHARFLAALLEHELAERAQRRIQRHLTEARLPPGKSLATFDFAAVPMVGKAQIVAHAAGGAWLKTGTNILLFGPPGVGKSHLAAALGGALVETGHRILFTRTTDLVQKLQAARQTLSLASVIDKTDRIDLLILDDLSYVRKDQAETSVLFELIAARYERRSLLITANQAFGTWDSIFPDPAMTVAAIDRLVHHAVILEINTESYRRREAAARTAQTHPPTR